MGASKPNELQDETGRAAKAPPHADSLHHTGSDLAFVVSVKMCEKSEFVKTSTCKHVERNRKTVTGEEKGEKGTGGSVTEKKNMSVCLSQ